MYDGRGYWVLGLHLLSVILNNTVFWKLDLFPSSVEEWETSTLLGPLEIANTNDWSIYIYIHHWLLVSSFLTFAFHTALSAITSYNLNLK
jgi:hypothetical protein